MKKTIPLLATLFAFNASASLITIETSLWTNEQSPARGSTAPWTSNSGTEASHISNGNSALISDFTLDGNFNFSGFLQPVGGDDDLVGLVFGWQDHLNHYRLGWENGQVNNGFDDISGASGMFLVREVAGTSTILFQQETFWQPNTSYDFSVGRIGSDISFSLNGIEQSFNDTNFMSGHVGLYTESQSANFGELSVTTSVPEPSTLAILGLGLLGLTSRKLTRKNKH